MVSARSSISSPRGSLEHRRAARMMSGLSARITKTISRNHKKHILSDDNGDDEDDIIIVDSRPRRNTKQVVYAESESEYESESIAEEDEDEDYVCATKPLPTKNLLRDIGSGAANRSEDESEYGSEGVESDTIEVEVVRRTITAIARSIDPSAPTEDKEAARLFKKLSLECHQHILQFLPSDKDVVSYALICKASSASVYNTIWRKRSQFTFDELPSLGEVPLDQIAMKYKYRRSVSNKWTCFDLLKFGGRIDKATREFQLQNQKDCLEMLRGLILESNAKITRDDCGNQVVKGLNLQYIRDMLTGENGQSYVDIVDAVFNTSRGWGAESFRDMIKIVSASTAESLVYVIQLCLTPFSLHPETCNHKISHFDISQYQAYERSSEQPMFVGKFKQDINPRWLLHVVNFFKYHLKAGGEGLLEHAYSDLDSNQYPQPWAGLIQPGVLPLGSHWKGAYMYMEADMLRILRGWNGSNSIVHSDSLDGNEAFQDITMFFDKSQFSAKNWPDGWENVLCSDPFKDTDFREGLRTSTRAKPSKQIKRPDIEEFWGSCRGSKNGHFFGRIHGMIPQQGIHGFQRITMMKFYTTVINGSHVYDPTQVWAYEGCVLPGGRIMVGRWWDARGDPADIDCLSGPFLWWNVTNSEASPLVEPGEAFDFMDLVEPELALRF